MRKLIAASAVYKRDGLNPEFWDFMSRATLQNMPIELKDAYLRVAPNPKNLPILHDKCVKRMLEFKDWPDEEIRSINAPTLVFIGDADVVRPEHAVEMFRLLPHSQLAVLPGGHGTYIGEATVAKKGSKLPNLVVSMIEEFLDAPMPEPK